MMRLRGRVHSFTSQIKLDEAFDGRIFNASGVFCYGAATCSTTPCLNRQRHKHLQNVVKKA